MSDCANGWTPNNTFWFFVSLLAFLYFTGLIEAIVEVIGELLDRRRR